MLYAFALILVALWLLGLGTSFNLHGLIHILPVIAIVLVVIRVIIGRKAP